MYHHTGLTNIINNLPCLLRISPDVTINFKLVYMFVLPHMFYIFIAYVQICKEYEHGFVFYINYFLWQIPFAVFVCFYSMLFLRILHVDACRCSLFLLSFADAYSYLGCFRLFSIMSSRSVSIFTCVLCICFSASVRCIPSSKLAGSQGICIFNYTLPNCAVQDG